MVHLEKKDELIESSVNRMKGFLLGEKRDLFARDQTLIRITIVYRRVLGQKPGPKIDVGIWSLN